MRLKMKTTLAGPDRVLQAGAVAEFDEAEARVLCDGGYAQALEPLAGAALAVEKDGAAVVEPQPPGAGQVEIPADWQKLDAKGMKALADQLVETPVKTRNEAIAVIEAELAARIPAPPSETPQDPPGEGAPDAA